MSYLGYPRLHFAGQFQVDVPTINNNPTHFDSARFHPSFHQYGDELNGWWNPNAQSRKLTRLPCPQGMAATISLGTAFGSSRRVRSCGAPLDNED
jgi:hypothetical protein